MTAEGRALEAARIPWNQGGKEAWTALTDQFSRRASGEVHVFLHEPVNPQGIWSTVEYVNLMWNSSVTNIVFHTVP